MTRSEGKATNLFRARSDEAINSRLIDAAYHTLLDFLDTPLCDVVLPLTVMTWLL